MKGDYEMENEIKPTDQAEKRNSIKEFFSLGEVGGYFFRKKDPSRPNDVNIRMMHGINKISIIVFLLGVIFIIVKRFL
jgi:hypothetical protein